MAVEVMLTAGVVFECVGRAWARGGEGARHVGMKLVGGGCY